MQQSAAEDHLHRKKREEDLRGRNEHWEDNDRVVRKEDSKRSKDSSVKERQSHHAPGVPRQLTQHELEQDYDNDEFHWTYRETNEPCSFERQYDDKKVRRT